MDTLLQDLRYAFRALRRTPAVTAVAIITLALGIGANSAIFSVLRGMLWRPLPYAEPEHATMLWSHWRGWDRTWVSAPEYADYAAQSQIFTSVGAYYSTALTVTGGGEAERLPAGVVTASVFDVLGVKPLLGRTFLAEEDLPNGSPAVVIGEGVWKRRFASDPAIVGQSLQLNARPYTVVGVMPEAFRLPDDFAGSERTQIWVPIQLGTPTPDNRGSHGLLAVGRLRPGLEAGPAQVLLDQFVAGMKQTYQQNYGPEFGVTLVTLPDEILGKVRPALLVLLGAVGLVLLIACGNVANLLLVRGEARQRELAIRTALGAGRARMIRQLLTESVLLAVLGGGAGIVLAAWGVDALPAINPSSLPRAEAIQIDLPVLLGTLALSLATGILFGLVPAWHLVRSETRSDALRETTRSVTAGVAGRRFRRVLIGAEVALAVVLVIGAGLLMRSFSRLTSVSPGFEPRGVLTMRLSLPAATYPTRTAVRAFYDRLFERVRALPGVEVAGAIRGLPLGDVLGDWGANIPGYTPPPNEGTPVDFQVASADYFRAMGIPLRKGRFLSESDREGAGAPVIMINEAAARKYWQGRDPVGTRMRLRADADSLWRTVVGVVGDVHHRGITEQARPEMYLPQLQVFLTAGDSDVPSRSMILTLRVSGDPMAQAAPVRRIIADLDRGLAVSDVRTLEDVVSRSIAAPRFTATLIGVFAALALVLAAVGIYGVVAYVVAQRTTELGIRVALGARAADVLRLVVGQGMQPVGYGLAAGVLAALVLSRLLTGLLFGITHTDVTTYAGVTVLLGTVALLACWMPARRAARTDPMIALRSE
jgi:putative ABC transport system permease protein